MLIPLSNYKFIRTRNVFTSVFYTHFYTCMVPGMKCLTHIRTDVTFRLFPILWLLVLK